MAFSVDGNTLELAVVDLNEGGLEGMRGHQAQALLLFEDAVKHSERFGSPVNLVHALGNEIDAYLELLQPSKALAVSDRIGRELVHMEESPDTRFVKAQQVQALTANGQINAARGLIAELITGIDPARDVELWTMLQASSAELDIDLGQWQSAGEHAESALGALRDAESAGVRSTLWLKRIQALRATQHGTEVAAETRNFSEWAHENDNPGVQLRADLALAELAWSEGRLDAAYQSYGEALHLAHEGGVPIDIAEVAVDFGSALLGGRDVVHASEVIGQTERWADTDFQCAVLQARLARAMGNNVAWRRAADEARSLAGQRPLPPEVTVQPSGSVLVAEHR
jgi:tetratricopeptide (TPR) repeat protein